MKKVLLCFITSLVLINSACSQRVSEYKENFSDIDIKTFTTDTGNKIEIKKDFFKTLDKTTLFEQSWKPEKESKAAIIIMHGLKDHSSRYDSFAKKLVEKNFSVYAFDLRGHGRSQGEKVWVNSFKEYTDDLYFFYERVMQREWNKPVFILGHSMGGAIVTLFALEKKPKLKGVVLSAPALQVGKDISPLKLGLVSFIGDLFPSLGLLELDDNGFSRDKKVVEEIKNDPLVYHNEGPAKTAKELLTSLEKIQNKMKDFTYPFLALHGTDDILTNPEGSKNLFNKAESKDKSLKIYDGFFHDLLHEPENERVSTDIINWLEERVN